MKMCVIIEEFLYAKKIENQTQRTLRGYKNTLNLFASWLEQKWSIDELENIRVSHLKQYVSYHLKVGHKGTYVNGIIKILRAFFKYTNGEDYTTIEYAQTQLKNGMDIYTLSRLLGHEKVSITQIYLQNMQDAQIVENAVNSSVIATLK